MDQARCVLCEKYGMKRVTVDEVVFQWWAANIASKKDRSWETWLKLVKEEARTKKRTLDQHLIREEDKITLPWIKKGKRIENLNAKKDKLNQTTFEEALKIINEIYRCSDNESYYKLTQSLFEIMNNYTTTKTLLYASPYKRTYNKHYEFTKLDEALHSAGWKPWMFSLPIKRAFAELDKMEEGASKNVINKLCSIKRDNADINEGSEDEEKNDEQLNEDIDQYAMQYFTSSHDELLQIIHRLESALKTPDEIVAISDNANSFEAYANGAVDGSSGMSEESLHKYIKNAFNGIDDDEARSIYSSFNRIVNAANSENEQSMTETITNDAIYLITCYDRIKNKLWVDDWIELWMSFRCLGTSMLHQKNRKWCDTQNVLLLKRQYWRILNG